MDILQFDNCVCVRNKQKDVVITVFDDCNHVYAVPQTDDEYIQRAKDLGYENSSQMNYEHDAVHCFLTKYLDYGSYKYSPSLYNVVVPGYSIPEIREIEERIVLDFQLYLNKCYLSEFLAYNLGNKFYNQYFASYFVQYIPVLLRMKALELLRGIKF